MPCHQGWAVEADKKKEQEIRKQDKKRTGKKDEYDDLENKSYYCSCRTVCFCHSLCLVDNFVHGFHS